MINRTHRIAAAMLLMTMTATAQSVDPVVAAERSFRTDVARLGVRDGFIANFADDGVLFRPGPVNAIEYLRGQEAQPGLLEWEPAFAAIAPAGDLGFTTGPWTYRQSAGDSVAAAGHYATVWTRGDDGRWRVAIDHGVGLGRPLPVPEPQAVSTPAGSTTPRPELVAARGGIDSALIGEVRARAAEELRRADREISIGAGRLEDAQRFLGRTSSDARFQHQGKLLISGLKTIESLVMGNPSGVTYAPAGAVVSSGADFGYTWGSYSPGAAAAADGGAAGSSDPTGNYLHVWRHEKSGWMLLFELMAPNPPKR